MTKRSAEISELENELRDMTGANGGLIETRWVSRLVELMREAVSTEAMECLLKVLLNTPQNDKATLSRFIQLGGIELLGQWINSYRVKPDLEHTLILNSCLSCLNKLSISTEILDKTQIGKTVNKLVKHPDSSIQAKANTIVSKWKKIVTEQDDTKRPQKLKNETRVVLPKKYSLCRPKVFEVVDNSEQVEEVSIQKTSHNILHNKIIESITTKKHIRWADQEKLEVLKYFWRTDESNAKCASLRPQDSMIEDELPKQITVEDFRKREIQMERELNRKVRLIQEKEKDGQVKVLLENMTPRVNYITPASNFYVGIKINFTQRHKLDSPESLDQIKREYSVQRVIYQRESEISRSPMEMMSQKSISLKEIITIPFFKAGSFPPKLIKITEQQQQGGMSDDFMKLFQQSQPMGNTVPAYPSMHPLMPHPPIYSHMVSPMPSRVGPLPSIPLPIPPNNVIPSYSSYSMPNHPMYDPNMISSQMDPYGMANKNRMIYNPITKKPQNFRTVPCRRFHSPDGCERGDNCHFIHDFQYQGRPIPNFNAWKNNNIRKNVQTINSYNPVAAYYPPPGPDINNNRTY